MGSMVELKAADGFNLAAYRAAPAGASKGGLVVIQEIFGVNHHIRNVAGRFADLGYTALAPALFDRAERGIDIGYDEASVNRGVKLRAKIKLEDTLLDVDAAIRSLKGAGKIAVVGYCWGGSLAFLAATRLSGLACAVGYYGGMIAAHAQEKPKVPVMLHFGEHDHGIPMTDVEKIKAARPETQIFTYNAGHGFSCDERASYDKASHEKALGRTLAFFDEHLGAKPPR
jgi:carboxymethylenebutenolidase